MKIFNLSKMIDGYLVGAVSPTAHYTESCEVAVKRYEAGYYKTAHSHLISTEVITVVSGAIEINGVAYIADDIIVISPEESADLNCLTEVVLCVYKSASVRHEKLEVDPEFEAITIIVE
jgi:hypothetical protein